MPHYEFSSFSHSRKDEGEIRIFFGSFWLYHNEVTAGATRSRRPRQLVGLLPRLAYMIGVLLRTLKPLPSSNPNTDADRQRPR